MKDKKIKKAILGLQKTISEIEKDIEIKNELISKYKETIEDYKSKISLDYEVGAILIAIDDCEMEDGSGEALIIGKEYEIMETMNCEEGMNIVIESENHSAHLFPFFEVLNYFKLKKI